MHTVQRRSEILRRLQYAGYVEPKHLAADFEVDSSTIRRDLGMLAAPATWSALTGAPGPKWVPPTSHTRRGKANSCWLSR